MTRDEARQEVRARITGAEYLTKSRGKLYCCPFCGSGTGRNHTGALGFYEKNGAHLWKCQVCGKSGDSIDLCQQANGCDYLTALSLTAKSLGIEIDGIQGAGATETGASGSSGIKPRREDKTPEIADFMPYYRECSSRIDAPEAAAYLNGRGISLETARAYLIGYDPEADPANAPGAAAGTEKPHPAPRIIIPTSKTHFVGRAIGECAPGYEKMNNARGTPGIFNGAALYKPENRLIYVVEGAFDALSILETGRAAIALNSASNTQLLLEKLEKRKTAATLILCPDNDADEGTRARVLRNFRELSAGLNELKVSNLIADINAGAKDANAALVADKAAFIAALEAVEKPDNTANYIDSLMQTELERFKSETKTGFKELDQKSGGLYSGLYVIAAISSLGKTSFSLQIADQIAAAGKDVIIFSLEQSRLELVSKSIARRTVTRTAGNLDTSEAVTSLEIRKGSKAAAVARAIEEYRKDTAGRVSIVERNFACDLPFIGGYLRDFVARTGARPVVFIDYLQILQPAPEAKRATMKENMDAAVTELKRISRELDLTIFVISSVNRANYLAPIDFESLKESGGIEYSCDVLWGLQLQCLNDPMFDRADTKIKEKREKVKQAKAENPRKIELVCLKNRYGIANFSCNFNYYPANDLFAEPDDANGGGNWKRLDII